MSEQILDKSSSEKTSQPTGADEEIDNILEDIHLIGNFEGHNVYHVVSQLEKKLAEILTRTAIPGYRYLRDKVEGEEPSSCSSSDTEDTGASTPATEETDISEEAAEKPLFANDYFEVKRSSLGGYGAFAIKAIPAEQAVLLERPLIRTNARDILSDFNKLTPAKQADYMSLHAHYQSPGFSQVYAIWTTNSFETGNTSTVYHLAARFNHACPPAYNVRYVHDEKRNIIVMTTSRDVEAGEELTICYGGSPESLYCRYGFQCICGACEGFSELDIAKLERRKWAT